MWPRATEGRTDAVARAGHPTAGQDVQGHARLRAGLFAICNYSITFVWIRAEHALQILSTHRMTLQNVDNVYYNNRRRYEKPPLASRCCHIAKISQTTVKRTNKQTNKLTNKETGCRHRVNFPHLQEEVSKSLTISYKFIDF